VKTATGQAGLYADMEDAARGYDSNRARWYTPDPLGLKGVSLGNPTTWNRFAYANGDPVNFYDPHGRIAESPDFCQAFPEYCSGGGGAGTPSGNEPGPGGSRSVTGDGSALADQQGVGGGGGAGNLRYWEGITAAGATTYVMQGILGALLGSFSEDCYGQVNDVLNLTQADLSANVSKLSFLDATGAAGQLTLSEVTGINFSNGSTSLSQYFAGDWAAAETLASKNSKGVTTFLPDVVLLGGFWGQPGDVSNLHVLVHELLHYSSQMNDFLLAKKFTGTETNDKKVASQAFSDWVEHCYK
jgi:RHS repeat-associated protein